MEGWTSLIAQFTQALNKLRGRNLIQAYLCVCIEQLRAHALSGITPVAGGWEHPYFSQTRPGVRAAVRYCAVRVIVTVFFFPRRVTSPSGNAVVRIAPSARTEPSATPVALPDQQCNGH